MIHGDDQPEAAIDGANSADARIFRLERFDSYVGWNLSWWADGVQQRAEGLFRRFANIGIVHLDRLDEGEAAIASPDTAVIDIGSSDGVIRQRARGEPEWCDIFSQG